MNPTNGLTRRVKHDMTISVTAHSFIVCQLNNALEGQPVYSYNGVIVVGVLPQRGSLFVKKPNKENDAPEERPVYIPVIRIFTEKKIICNTAKHIYFNLCFFVSADALIKIKLLNKKYPVMKDAQFRLMAIVILLTGFGYTTTVCTAQSTAKQSLLALSKADHVLAIVDPATLKVITRIPVGEDPHEVIASADGKTAYVTIYGGGSLHELNVIDLVAQKALANVDTRPLFGPHGITFVNGKAWFTAEGSKAIGSYDPATGKIDWSMGTGQDRTHMIYVTADAKKIYTSNISSGTVSILTDSLIQPGKMAPPGAKPRNEWIHTVVPTARGSEGFDVSPDGKELWTASSEDGTISIIDLTTNKPAGRIDAKVNGANRLLFTLNGEQVFISSLQTGELTIYNSKTRKEVKRIKLGRGAAGIQMDPNGSRVFVAVSSDNYIAVIDLKTLQVTGKLDVGGTPDGMAWAAER